MLRLSRTLWRPAIFCVFKDQEQGNKCECTGECFLAGSKLKRTAWSFTWKYWPLNYSSPHHAQATPYGVQLFAPRSICCAFKEQEQDKMFVRAPSGSTLKQNGQQCDYLLYLRNLTQSASLAMPCPSHTLWCPAICSAFYLLHIQRAGAR